MIPKTNVPDEIRRDLEAVRARHAMINRRNDRWVGLDLSTNVIVSGAVQADGSWMALKEAGARRAQLTIRLPYWLACLVCVIWYRVRALSRH